MKQSESIVKLAAALTKAQAEMGGAVKDASNPFFKSKYADLASVIRAVKEPCAKHGLSYLQLPIRSENGVGVVTRLLHESGEWLEGEYTLPMVKNDPQAAGSAITYARRYALSALFAIPQVDTDAEDAMLRGTPEPLPEKPLEQWVEDLADSILVIKEGIASGDIGAAAQAWFELSDDEKRGLWVAPTRIVEGKRVETPYAPWTTAERDVLKSSEFKTAYHGNPA
jgi:hypothetical protein